MRTAPILASLLALAIIPTGAAQADQGNTAAPTALVREALLRAESGQLDAATTSRLANDPLVPWIEYAALRRDLSRDDPGDIHRFLDRYSGQVAASMLREAWLQELARRDDWKDFRAFYTSSGNTTLRCANLAARLDAGEPDGAWFDDALALWQTGDALTNDCDSAYALLATRGKLTDELRWKRIDAAAEDASTGVMRSAARGLPADQAAQANAYAAFIDAPNDSASSWPKTERSRHIAAIGLALAAKRDPGIAAARLAKLSTALQMDEADRGRVLYAVALWTVGSYLPDSAQRLAAVPASAYDARLHEWQVREAMSRGDDKAALKAIVAMDPVQRSDPHWQYFEARLRERMGDSKAANALYAQAARTATFHGFLAADRLHQPYNICPMTLSATNAERARVAATPALVRALELFQVERKPWAEREWKQALSGFDDRQRQIAVALAQEAGWYDRALFALGKDATGKPAPDELRMYALRFPLNNASVVQEQARNNGIDRSWIAAEIRAESGWMSDAHSAANARGLMQLLPSVGATMARTLGIAWNGGDTLYEPLTNIALGSAYLRQMLDRFNGQTYIAIGAYNAGAGPVNRWLAQRPQFDPDFWIETVSYKETRDYIARVLAFSVIYDWRFDGKAVPLTDRMLGRTVPDAQKRGFTCVTAPVAATTDSEAQR